MDKKIIQCGYMSGDTYSAAALLKVDPSVKILLIKDTKGTGAYADKSNLILQIYQETAVNNQVTLIDLSDTETKALDIWKEVGGNYKLGKKTYVPVKKKGKSLTVTDELCWSYKPTGEWPRSITSVTGLLADIWCREKEKTQRAIAEAWKIGKLPTGLKFALYGYMGTKFKKINFDIRKNILVLWSRQSGKKGGAHLELDSSYEGIRQLALYFAVSKPRATVLLAGDERDGKLAELANKTAHIIDISEMWNDPVWTEHFGPAKFLGQFAFFKYLAEEYKVIHLGMRSGILEAMALLGMETFYLEPISLQNTSGTRMVAFKNKGITYKRIQINWMPGLTARIADKKRIYSNEILDEKLNNKADDMMNSCYFPYDKSKSHDANKIVGLKFAKAKLSGQTLDFYTSDLAKDMASLRGFDEEDRGQIFKIIEDSMIG